MSDSTQILALARAHFDNMRGQEIEIPEWSDPESDDTLVGFYDPPTLRVRQAIQRRAGKSEGRMMALVVILCLKDKDGKTLFQDDAESLATLESKVDPKVVARVAQSILQTSEDSDLGN